MRRSLFIVAADPAAVAGSVSWSELMRTSLARHNLWRALVSDKLTKEVVRTALLVFVTDDRRLVEQESALAEIDYFVIHKMYQKGTGYETGLASASAANAGRAGIVSQDAPAARHWT